MEYVARFGLEFNPFIKNSKDILIENRESQETLYRLNYLLNVKGFGLLTGSPGCGKTTIVRNWASNLNQSLYKVTYTSLSTLTVIEFYKNLVSGLGCEPAYRKTDNFKLIQNEIMRLAIEKRITPVIIIDEANYVNSGILNDLKMIFNFDMDSKDRAILLLVGLPQLNNTLRLGVHEPLRQRIIMNYNVEPLTKDEGRTYISAKLKHAGCLHQVFSETAIEAILNYSNGTPRLINKICNTSLLLAHNKKVDIVDDSIVMLAISDMELS